MPACDRERLEPLCRHVARPAIASERLALAADGRGVHGLRGHWRDGTSAVSFDTLTFIALIGDNFVVRKTLHPLGLPSKPPRLGATRGCEELDVDAYPRTTGPGRTTDSHTPETTARPPGRRGQALERNHPPRLAFAT